MSSSERFMGIRDVPIARTSDDDLELGRYADALGRFVLGCDTPITVGIQGDWGSGKTSIMNLVEEFVKAKGRVLTITVNTWQYAQVSTSETLPLVLLQGLQRKVIKDKGAVREFMGKAAKVFAFKTINLGPVGVELGDWKDDGDAIDLDDLKASFAKLVKERLHGSGSDRIVVFIDDLDRVLPVRAVEILEVLKNFVDVEGCVFVIACDYEVVVKGLKQKFQVGEEDLGGRSFFDKIIQVPFRMPVHSYNVTRYIGRMLERIDWPAGDADLEDYRALLEQSVGFNPRSVKRLCNTLLLLKNVAEGGTDSQEVLSDPRRLKILFGLVCLESCYEPVHRALQVSNDPELISAIMLKPEQGLNTEDLALVREMPDFEDKRHLVVEFLKTLGGVVDANSDGKLDEKEIDVLNQMMSLSSITSVADERVAESKTRRSADELVQIAQGLGFAERALRLRSFLQHTSSHTSGFRERRTKTTFSYDIDQRLLGEPKKGWPTVLQIQMWSDDKVFRVGFFPERLPRDEAGSAHAALVEFVQAHGELWNAEWGGGYWGVRLDDVEAVDGFCQLLGRLEPFQSTR